MHSDWFSGTEILQGRWQHGEKVGYCFPSGLENTPCRWDTYVPLVTEGLRTLFFTFENFLKYRVCVTFYGTKELMSKVVFCVTCEEKEARKIFHVCNTSCGTANTKVAIKEMA
jgi:hypothetical protein